MYNEDEITSHPDWNAQAYRVYLKCERLKNNAESRELFFERYRGEWDSEEAYARDWYESSCDMSALPEWVRNHINWESVATELFSIAAYSDDSSDRGIFVFDDC